MGAEVSAVAGAWLAARRISVLLSQTSVAKGYPRHKKEGAGSLYVALGGVFAMERGTAFFLSFCKNRR